MPVIGHVAGIYARTDINKNVGKAPGGTVDGALRFLTGLELDTTQGERDTVYPNKIFDTGAVYDKIAGSWEYFPRSSTERDPEGMALHYELSSAGNTFAIIPNAWTAQEDTRRGRRERKATYRFQKRRDKKTRFEDLTK